MEAPETHKEKQVDSDSDDFNRLLDEFIQATLTEQVDDETVFTQEDEENEMLTSTGDEETPITPDSDDFERWLEGFIQCKLAEEDDEPIVAQDDEESSEES